MSTGTIAITVATLVWLVSEPWYQHLPWPTRAVIVLVSVAPGVLAARSSRSGQADRSSRSGQEEDQ